MQPSAADEKFTAYQVVHVHVHVSGPKNMRRRRQDTDHCMVRMREKGFSRKDTKGRQVDLLQSTY